MASDRQDARSAAQKHELQIVSAFASGYTAANPCGKAVYWWDGEYEGECELPEGHGGDHFDGQHWFNDAGEDTDDAHT